MLPRLFALALALGQSDDVQRYMTAAARLYENLEYERALEQLDRAKKLSRGIDDDVNIALYEGAIRADMGQAEQSEAAFKTGLFLKPDAKLPVKVSPKVEQDFEAVRVKVKKELAPILEKQRKAEEERRKAEADAAAKAKATPPAHSDAPTQETQTSKLIVASSEPTKANIEIVAPPPEHHTPVAPFVLLGGAVVAGGVGGFFGLQSQSEVSAAKNANFESDAVAHLGTARTDATVANVLFGLAGAAAIATAISFAVSSGE